MQKSKKAMCINFKSNLKKVNFLSILADMLLQLYGKNKKNSERQFFIKLETPHFSLIPAPFVQKTSTKDFSKKKKKSHISDLTLL